MRDQLTQTIARNLKGVIRPWSDDYTCVQVGTTRLIIEPWDFVDGGKWFRVRILGTWKMSDSFCGDGKGANRRACKAARQVLGLK